MSQLLLRICMSWKGRIEVVIRGSWDLLTAFYHRNIAECSLEMKPYLHLALVSYPAFPIASA